MEDDRFTIPERPDTLSMDLVIPDVSSFRVRLLMELLEEKASEERENGRKFRTVSDVFSDMVHDILVREYGMNGVRERHEKYQDDQTRIQGTFIRFCNRTGYDPDVEAGAAAYPEVNLDLDIAPEA
ncbi:MAG: hypothetical protein ABW157_13535 [Candidatus Thiodiazotropha sp. LLP2]